MKLSERELTSPELADSVRSDPAAAGSALAVGDGRTRDAVLHLIHGSRALTAAAIAEQLHLSAAGVRRHLDALVTEGLLAEVQPRLAAARGRGRPARGYALTDTGRTAFPHAYDDLASTALSYLRVTGGQVAVAAFAEHRAADLATKLRKRIDPDAASPVEAVADALSQEGFAAKAMTAGAGIQICQHHCPIAHVAAEFPELCAAETAALAEVLGTYVQRLATIAHGDGVCTTHIPHPPVAMAAADPVRRQSISMEAR